MRTAYLSAVLFFVGSNLFGQQNAEPTQGQKPKPTVRNVRPSIVSRDANSRVWQRTTYDQLPSGEIAPHLRAYTELATGMHYQKDGQWVESKEQIDLVPTGGAAATQGQHKVYFPYDIYNGVIEIVTGDGEHLKARPLAISYFDGTNNVLVGQLTNSVGMLVVSNQVIYTNAFTDIEADLICTYRRSGFECDLVFRSQPPTPEAYGLNSSITRLELLTEFFDTPEPQQTKSQTTELSIQGVGTANTTATQPGASTELADTSLKFGAMTMIRGTAFALNVSNGARQTPSSPVSSGSDLSSSVNAMDTPVSKIWTTIEGRTFLIEEVPVESVSAGLQSLPIASSRNLTLHKASTSRSLPPSRIAQSSTNQMEMASAAVNRPGLVLDYNIVNSQTNLTFQGDQTYYLSGTVNLYGTNVIEGGAVIKYDTNSDSTLNILGYLQCRTGPYHPAIFTSADDESVGEWTSSSSPPSCTNTFNLQVNNDTGENLLVSVYDDDSTYVVDHTIVNPGDTPVFTFTAGLGQHFVFDAFDEDGHEYYLEFWTSQEWGSLSAGYDPDSGPSVDFFGVGSDLCTPPTVACTALSLANGANLSDLIIRNVGTGIQSSSTYSVTNIQIVNCQTMAFKTQNASLYAGNVLIAQSTTAFGGQSFTVQVEQLTCASPGNFAYSTSGTSSIAVTNAILTDVFSWGNTTVYTNQVIKISGTGVYQIVGAGNYYLATNSPYRNVGTTNINPSLLASIRGKTTYPPTTYLSITISTNAEFGPRVGRDMDIPDLGFHYYPLDYCFVNVTANSNITFDAGTAVGYYEFGGTHGIALGNHVTNNFSGTAAAPIIFARFDTVQEGGTSLWISKGSTAGGITTVGNSSYSAQVNANFTKFYGMASDPKHFADFSSQLNVQANNCEFYDASMNGSWLGLNLTNCLSDRVASIGSNPKSAGLFWENCTFHGGTVLAFHSGTGNSNWPVRIENCVFDGTSTNMNDYSSGDSNITYCAYNAFVNGAQKLVITNVHDLVVSNFTWQTGLLGNWYQSPTSSLINTGSVTADVVRLYHFTTQTNQTKETNSIVDLGYHYVALDSFGNPVDTDGDGTPDYIEDSNGNGNIDSGESSWLLGIVTQPQSQNVVQGQDVVFSVVAGGITPFSYQWRTNGINIPGATSSSLTNFVVTTNNEANYSVVVTNSSGSVTSSIAVLTVNSFLAIQGPTNQTVFEGTNVSFTVTVTDGNHPVFQWYTNGTAINNGSRISGATTSTLTISNVVTSDAKSYTCVVSNLAGSVTSSAALTVIAKPVISSVPANTTIIQADDVTLSASVLGQFLYFQWWLTNISGTTMIPNATSQVYTKLVAATNDAGHYSLVVTNPAGSTNVNADLTVLVPPWITQQPASVTNNQGANVTLTVSAVGTAGLFYQWYKWGTNALSAATNSTLTLNNIQTNDAAGYLVLVTNLAGTNLSAWAWLSVNPTGGGATVYGWGGGSAPPQPTMTNVMVTPANIYATNPAIYLVGTALSIRASAVSHYNDITNVAFYFTGTNYVTNSAGTAVPGSNSIFAVAWTNALHGTNILFARAWDCGGNATDSVPVYVVMDQKPAIITDPPTASLTWEGIVTNLWFTNYVSDDSLPYGITNISWSIPDGVTTSNVYTYTSSNIIIGTYATFTNWGTYSLGVSVSDGFATSSSACAVKLNHRPLISFNSPTNNSAFVTNSRPLVLDVTASNLDGTVANVKFYDGIGLSFLGTATPGTGNSYRYAWYNPPLGVHLITAVATDSDTLTSSTNIVCSVVPPLTVEFHSPTNNEFFVLSPTNIFLTAYPTNYAGGTITSVFFTNLTQGIYIGAGTATNAGYQTLWEDLTNGSYNVSVTARDSAGNVASKGVVIKVNAMPAVSIVTPTNLQAFSETMNVLLTAIASDIESGTNLSVVFYYTNAPIGTGVYVGGFSNVFVWNSRTANSQPTNYFAIIAVATDTNGASAASSFEVFKVTSTNPLPAIRITYPTNLATFAADSDITITAVTNGIGTLTNVEFFVNGEDIGGDPSFPYSITECCWKPGTYVLMARATDDQGKTFFSAPVTNFISNNIQVGWGFWDPNFFFVPDLAFGDGGGAAGFMNAMASDGTNIFVTSWGDLEESPLMQRWDGTNWNLIGSISGILISNEVMHEVMSILPMGSDIYVAGILEDSSTAENRHPGVLKWNGTEWVTVGDSIQADGFSDFVTDKLTPCLTLAMFGGDIYLGGAFSSVADTNTIYLAKLNTHLSRWDPVGDRLNGPVFSIAQYQGNLVIGGCFTNASGNTNANYVAILKSSTWANLGEGVSGVDWWDGFCTDSNVCPHQVAVWSLAQCAGNLYAGGSFTTAGTNLNANGIGLWDGTNWSSVGRGLVSSRHFGTSGDFPDNPKAYKVIPFGNTLLVSGIFGGVEDADGTITRALNVAEATWSESLHEWKWGDLDLGVCWSYPDETRSFAPFMQLIRDPASARFDVYVGGSFALAGSGEILESATYSPRHNIARWRVGFPETNGPRVTITAPLTPTIVTNPADIFLSATVTSRYTNITEVHFYTNGVDVGYFSGYSSSDSYPYFYDLTNEWSSHAPGLYVVTAAAKDAAGQVGTSRPLVVNIKDPDGDVSAFDDEYSVVAGTSMSLQVLTNDSPSSGLQITQLYSEFDLGHAVPTHKNIGKATISADRRSIIYTAFANNAGIDTFYYTVTNGSGSSDGASVTVTVLAPPSVEISSPQNGDVTNASASVHLNAIGNGVSGTLTNIALYLNGGLLGNANTNNIAITWNTNVPDFYTFVAKASDDNGATGSSLPTTIAITNSSTATNILTASIDNLPMTTNISLKIKNFITVTNGLFDLKGVARDSNTNDPVSYQLLLYKSDNSDISIANVTPQPVDANGFHHGTDTNGDLGIADFTTVANGIYDVVLTVRGGASETNVSARFILNSQLKIGQFSFSEQDLVLPVNGIPITVTRTYDSLNPGSGPFGASWSFALTDLKVQLDDERMDVTVGNDTTPLDDEGNTDGTSGLPRTVSIRTGGGWDVTLTLPDGRRVTFPFQPRLGENGYYAEWGSPPGVNATLTVDPYPEQILAYPYPHWQDSRPLNGTAPYQNHDIKAWILKTADGTKYHITRGQGQNVIFDPDGTGDYISALAYGPPQLTEIEQLSTNKIIINSNGIFNYDPTNALTRWALFEYDDAGRIKALRDPNGGSNGLPVVNYVYDNDTGNLIQVLKLADRAAGTYTTNKYHYDNVKFPHYITSIENGDGIPVARNFYDDSGRLTAVQDANGTLTRFNHSTTNNSEFVIDRLGHTNSYIYDLSGNVIWATNALGQVTATAYTNSIFPNLETAVTNAYGTAQATWALYFYDSNGNQTNVISMGHTNSFQYDGAGNLLMQVDPLGNITRNFYDDSGNLTNTTQYDPNNNPVTSSSSVYANGKLVATVNANNQTTATFGYDQFGNLTNTTDANGFSRGFSYDANGNQTGSSYTWTPSGGGSSKTVTTANVYDGQNRVIQTIDPFGNTNRTVYNTSGKVDYTIDKFGNTNSFLYDALGNLIQTTYPNNTSTRTVYDAAGRATLTSDRNGVTGTRTDCDAAGRATNTVRLTNVVVDIVYSGSVASSVVTSGGTPISTNSTVYDAAGRVTSRTSPDGTTSYDYYPDGQLMHVIDALNQTNFYAYDAAGRQTNAVDALNHSTKFQYDAVGRMIATTYNDNTYTTNIFDALGQRTGVKDQAGLLTQFGYNISGQLTNVIKPTVPDPENGGTPNPTWSYLYDSYGRPTVTIDPKVHGTTNIFDAYGRQFSQRLTMNQTNLVQYDSFGRVVTNFDFKGQWTRFCYDSFGRVRAKYLYTSTGNLSNSVCYQYNQLDQLTNITERYGADAVNNSCTDCVAQVGTDGGSGSDSRLSKTWVIMRVTSPKWGAPLAVVSLLWLLLSLPFGRRLRNILSWYLRGGWRLNVATVCNRRTKRLRLPSYFWRGITLVSLIVLIADDPSWDYAFAQCSPPASSNIVDNTALTRVTSYSYDFDGRMTQMNSPEGYINYGYDTAVGRLLSTCTTNSYITNGYDALGRLKTITALKRNGTNLLSPEITTNFYDNVGNRSEVDLPNGVKTTYLYDSLNRLTNLTHKVGTTTNAIYKYVLDATGRRTNAVEVLRQEDNSYLTNTITWQFDRMYRLTNEVSLCSSNAFSYTNAYVYGLAGNRLKRIRTSSSTITTTNLFDANDELLREVTQTGSNYTETNNYAYDANGSMIGLTNSAAAGLSTNVYGYNLMNKLSSLTSGATITGFQYNDQGIRVRVTGASPKYYLIDANNHTGYQQVLEEFTTLGSTPARSYIIGDDVLAQADSGAASYLLYDGHGSTRQVADNSGSVASRYNYDAYGITQVGTTTISPNPDTSFQYCGEQFDSTLGMYNLRARYYNPSNGRFNRRDSFAGKNFDPQSLHKYSYVYSDPINGIDPSGKFTLTETLVSVAILSVFVLATVATLRTSTRPGIQTRVVFPPNDGPPIYVPTPPGNTPWLAALLTVMSIILTEAVRESGKSGQSEPTPQTTPQGETSQTGTTQIGKDQDLKDVYVHYSQYPPESFAKGLVPPAYVTDMSYSGLDSDNAMFGFGIAPPKYEYFFRIDRWTMLDPPDINTPRRWIQYKVIQPTGAGSMVAWREVPQTHKGKQP